MQRQAQRRTAGEPQSWGQTLAAHPVSACDHYTVRPLPPIEGLLDPLAAGAGDSEVGEEAPLPHTHIQAGRETEAQRGKPGGGRRWKGRAVGLCGAGPLHLGFS